MSKGGGSKAPPSVDPNALAQAQLGANLQTAQQQSALNNIRTTSPFGYSGFEQDPSGRWNLTQSLNPQTADVFGTQTDLASFLAANAKWLTNQAVGPANLGADLLNNEAGVLARSLPSGPISTAGLPALPSSSADFSNEVKQAQNAAYNTQAGFLNPQFAQKESDLEQQLADQGLSPGTQAYDRAKADLGRQETLAYQQAQNAGVAAGNEEQARLFGENLQGRQQGINERALQWQQPFTALQTVADTGENILGNAAAQLPELGSLANFAWAGGIPTFGGSPTAITPANVVGAQGAANTANINRFAAGNTLNNQLLNGIGSLGGTLGASNLLFGSQGLGGALGLDPTTGLFGSLFGAGADPFASAAAIPFSLAGI